MAARKMPVGRKMPARKAAPMRKVKHTKAHPGFQALVKRGVPAGALANAARNASPAAKRKNPRLKRVKGKAR